MKRIAIVAIMLMLSLGASARSIHYFTYSQATRTVNHLNRQSELMIYCGYDYEIETYVLINDIWMERVNSAYYEIWLFGYDAYTGEEIYMPLDLQCVWLYSAGRMYNAAQYLRFRVDARVPSIVWHIPPYNPYTRVSHRAGYTRTYHYDVHRHGWMPPAHTPGPGAPHPAYHPYYMRQPHTLAPMPESTWTPGVERPKVTIAERTRDTNPTTGTKATNTTRSTSSANTAAPTTSRANGTSRTSSTAPSSRSTSATSTTPTKATSTSRSTSATSSTSTGESSTSRSTSVTPSTPASTSRSTSTISPSPAKISNATRSTSVTPSAPSSSRSINTSPSTPSKASSSTRSTSATPSTPAKATNTSRSVSASPSTPTKAGNTTRSTSIKRP